MQYFVLFLSVGHTWKCSEVTPDFILKDHSWQCSVDHMGVQASYGLSKHLNLCTIYLTPRMQYFLSTIEGYSVHPTTIVLIGPQGDLVILGINLDHTTYKAYLCCNYFTTGQAP